MLVETVLAAVLAQIAEANVVCGTALEVVEVPHSSTVRCASCDTLVACSNVRRAQSEHTPWLGSFSCAALLALPLQPRALRQLGPWLAQTRAPPDGALLHRRCWMRPQRGIRDPMRVGGEGSEPPRTLRTAAPWPRLCTHRRHTVESWAQTQQQQQRRRRRCWLRTRVQRTACERSKTRGDSPHRGGAGSREHRTSGSDRPLQIARLLWLGRPRLGPQWRLLERLTPRRPPSCTRLPFVDLNSFAGALKPKSTGATTPKLVGSAHRSALIERSSKRVLLSLLASTVSRCQSRRWSR
jgi:hypothetical protein